MRQRQDCVLNIPSIAIFTWQRRSPDLWPFSKLVVCDHMVIVTLSGWCPVKHQCGCIPGRLGIHIFSLYSIKSDLSLHDLSVHCAVFLSSLCGALLPTGSWISLPGHDCLQLESPCIFLLGTQRWQGFYSLHRLYILGWPG